MNNVKIFAHKIALAEAIANDTVSVLKNAIAHYGSAVWVVAGGSTPESAYTIITKRFSQSLDWSKVTLVMGDERIVPVDSPDSNSKMIRDTLLVKLPLITYLQPPTDNAENGAGEYASQLSHLEKTMTGLPRFDVVWLGMGEDGHTLSLFPGHADFTSTEALVIPVHHSPKPPADRLSLTLAALKGAQRTFILAAGDNKAEILPQALKPASHLPVSQAAALTHAIWYIDQPAARLL